MCSRDKNKILYKKKYSEIKKNPLKRRSIYITAETELSVEEQDYKVKKKDRRQGLKHKLMRKFIQEAQHPTNSSFKENRENIMDKISKAITWRKCPKPAVVCIQIEMPTKSLIRKMTTQEYYDEVLEHQAKNFQKSRK